MTPPFCYDAISIATGHTNPPMLRQRAQTRNTATIFGGAAQLFNSSLKSRNYFLSEETHRIHRLLGGEIAERKGTDKIVAAGDPEVLSHFFAHRVRRTGNVSTFRPARFEVTEVLFSPIVAADRLEVTCILVELGQSDLGILPGLSIRLTYVVVPRDAVYRLAHVGVEASWIVRMFIPQSSIEIEELTDNRHRLVVHHSIESLCGQPCHGVTAIRRIPQRRIGTLKGFDLELDVLEREVATLVGEFAGGKRRDHRVKRFSEHLSRVLHVNVEKG